MIILASNSISRANLLKTAGIDFKQISFDYDENLSKNLLPSIYVQKIVLEKEKQFLNHFKDEFKDEILLFADSIVCIENEILTKAKSKEEAYRMLSLQNNHHASILSAFLLNSKEKRIFSLSKTTLYFKEFNKNALEEYVENETFKGKAGAIMCEGFHKNYIYKQIGNLSTALGLNIEFLKAFL